MAFFNNFNNRMHNTGYNQQRNQQYGNMQRPAQYQQGPYNQYLMHQQMQNVQHPQGMPQQQMRGGQFSQGMRHPQGGQLQQGMQQGGQFQQGMQHPQGSQPQQGMQQQQTQYTMPTGYEDLDENTKAQVRKIIEQKRLAEGNGGGMQGGQPGAAMQENVENIPPIQIIPQSEIALEPVSPPQTASTKTEAQQTTVALMDFIQGERNAALFYTELSDMARDNKVSYALRAIAKGSSSRKSTFDTIYKDISGNAYEVNASDIVNVRRVSEGIDMAIDVENKFIRDISNLYDSLDNERHLRKINSIIHKKFCDLSSLYSISKQLS